MSPTRLLDLTRLTSRLGQGPLTGVDRVEFAYLGRLLQEEGRIFGLVRSAVGFLLLDRTGMAMLHDGQGLSGRVDLIGRLAYPRNSMRARVEADLRRVAVDRCIRPRLRAMLARHLPQGSVYLAVGHANLDPRSLSHIAAAGLKIAVMIHDTIPLDFPQFARPGTIEPFRAKVDAVARHADLVIHTTLAAREMTEAHFAGFGRVPRGVVANLGITLAKPEPLPFPVQTPYFICLGTIEPRKNHALLLDVWERLPKPRLHLYIVGGRGWSNEAVFRRLDNLAGDAAITELRGLRDGQVTTLLIGAQGLLFPSFAEGFGLPALEAAALGTRQIVSDLKVFRELLGNSAVYLDPTDSYSWMETILRQIALSKEQQEPKNPPSWQNHFNAVFREL